MLCVAGDSLTANHRLLATRLGKLQSPQCLVINARRRAKETNKHNMDKREQPQVYGRLSLCRNFFFYSNISVWTPGMGRTVLLRESALSVPVTVTNRSSDSFYIRYIRSRVYMFTLYGGVRSRGDDSLFVCVYYLRDHILVLC